MSETRNSDYKLPKIIFISVVRDFKMYDRLVRKNVYNSGADFIAFDNRNENIGIASRYNFFLMDMISPSRHGLYSVMKTGKRRNPLRQNSTACLQVIYTGQSVLSQ